MSAASESFTGFVLLAIALCLLPSTWLVGADWQIVALATAILLFGLPHGAFDIVLLGRLPRHLLMLATVYLALTGTVVALWWVAPALFLVAFLALSALHFGDSDWPDGTLLEKVAWGVSVIAIPVAVQAEEARSLFNYLAPWNAAAWLTSGVAGLAALSVPVIVIFGSRRVMQLGALAALAFLAWRTSALLAFTAYFCALHARLHLRHWMTKLEVRLDWKTLALAVLVMVCVGVTLVLWPAAVPLDAAVLTVVFVALASLTVPHMLTIHLARRYLEE